MSPLAKFGEKWYRVMVFEFDHENGKVTVLHVDYGGLFSCSFNDMKPLPLKYMKVPRKNMHMYFPHLSNEKFEKLQNLPEIAVQRGENNNLDLFCCYNEKWVKIE